VSFIRGAAMFDTEREGIWESALKGLSVTDTVYLMKFQREAIFLFLIYAKTKKYFFKIVVQGVLGGIFGSRSTA
jgi:hypothetical protein